MGENYIGLDFDPEKIKQYLKELEKLGVILDLEDVMGISWEDSEEIGFTIDGSIALKKDKIKGSE